TVSSPLNIAAGATSGMATASGGSAGTTTINASAPNFGGTSTVLVVKTIVVGFNPSGTATVAKTISLTRSILLSDAAPPGGLSVTIPEGSTYLPNGFTVTGLLSSRDSSGVDHPITITASAQNWTGKTAQISVVNPVLNLRNVLTPRTTASAAQEIWADVTNPSCGCGDVLNAPVTVTFSVDSSIVTLDRKSVV